jgi:hypothetical protein
VFKRFVAEVTVRRHLGFYSDQWKSGL